MANKMRWRYGDTNPVMLPVAADTVIEIGDLVGAGQRRARARRRRSKTSAREAANQEAFHDAFVGVAMQHSPAGSTDADPRRHQRRVRDGLRGRRRSTSATWWAPTRTARGTALENQVVAKVATPNLAVGRCARARRIRPRRACSSRSSARSCAAARRRGVAD